MDSEHHIIYGQCIICLFCQSQAINVNGGLCGLCLATFAVFQLATPYIVALCYIIDDQIFYINPQINGAYLYGVYTWETQEGNLSGLVCVEDPPHPFLTVQV